MSGIVRDAFIARRHDAVSCDLLPSERPGPHITGDVLPLLDQPWDMVIAFPPCTYLCSSGLHWTVRGKRDPKLTEDALDFVRALLSANSPKIALENPTGCISTRIRKYDQKIQPWQFGHDASKGTCLWLKNLPELKHTKIVPPKGFSLVKYAFECESCPDCGEPFCMEHDMHYSECDCIGPTQDDVYRVDVEGYEFAKRGEDSVRPVWGNQTKSGQNKLGPSDDRATIRSRTYQGIADAMAEQWGGL